MCVCVCVWLRLRTLVPKFNVGRDDLFQKLGNVMRSASLPNVKWEEAASLAFCAPMFVLGCVVLYDLLTGGAEPVSLPTV